MLTAIVVCLVLSNVAANQIQNPSSSQELNQLIQEHRYVLTYFRREQQSCPDCNRVLAELTDASKYIEDHEIAIATINCTSSRDLCDSFNVPLNYPCLKFFDSTTVIDYYGNYDREAIVFNIRRLTGPTLANLQTADDLNQFVATFNESMVMFLNADGSDSFVEFAAAATHLRTNTTFAYAPMSVLSEIGTELTEDQNSVVLLYTTLRSDPVLYLKKEISTISLQDFINVERYPSISHINPDNYSVYFDRGLPIVWCFLAADDKRYDYLEILKKVARKSRSELSWVWLDAVENGNHAVNLGLDFSWPGIVVDNIASSVKFVYPADQPFDDDNLSIWITKVLTRQVQPHVRSERPLPFTSGPLIRAVGENYMEIISDKSKDAFVIVTSKSWCGACKVVDPQVLTVAEIFQNHSSVLIVEIDGSLNDVALDFIHFPAAFFYPAGNPSKPISYGGPYTFTAISQFILDHTRTLTPDDRQAVTDALQDISNRSQQSAKSVDINQSKFLQPFSEKDEL